MHTANSYMIWPTMWPSTRDTKYKGEIQ